MKKAGYLDEIDRLAREKRAEDARTVKRAIAISFLLAGAVLLIEPALVPSSVKAFAYGLISMLK